MKWYKRLFMWLFSFVFLSLPVILPLNSYASTTESGYIPTIQEQWAQNIYDNYIGVIENAWKFSAPENVFEELWNDYITWCYDVWNLDTDNELQHEYHTFERYVGSQWQVERVPNVNQYSWNIDNSTQNYINTWIQDYVQENPLGYVECSISSYNFLNASLNWNNYAQYNTLKEFIKNQDGYTLVMYGYVGNGNTHIGTTYICVIPKTVNLGFIGTVVGGSYSNGQTVVNWQTTGQPYAVDSKCKTYVLNANGQISEYTVASSGWRPTFNSIHNGTGSMTGTSIYTNLSKNEYVYIFANANAYKNYNSGNPQPYYIGEGYNGTCINPNGNGNYINNGGYQSIVGQVTSGMTADDIIKIINAIQNGNGNGSGSDGSGSDQDNPFGFLGKIGEIIGQLVSGVGDLLTGIVDGIANVFLGTPDENGVRQGGLFSIVKGVINGLVELIDTDFVEFFNVVFDWLPQEVITIMISGLTFALFFGILKMIRG